MLDVKKGNKNFYVGDSEEDILAEMTYTTAGDSIIIIDGTSVSDKLRGQGVAAILLDELINWARNENKKIVPLCPYAKAQMNKNQKYHDMIHI